MTLIHSLHLDYLFVFLQSMGSELLFILFIFWWKVWDRKTVTPTVLLTNACTHTTVIFILMRSGNYLESVLISELFAFLAEAFVYRQTILRQQKWPVAYIVSLIANLISWQIGPWLTRLWS
jgi:hypothetical protein